MEKELKKILSILIAMMLSVSLMACGKAADSQTQTKEEDNLLSGKHHVTITVQDYGDINVELDADVAPITVTNFINLANDGFYDGLTFHRIIKGFMIQGGDPLGNGTGGSDNKIKGEFSNNDSASSQFFIVHKDSTYLDGNYACFGYVTDGMDIVDKICANVKATDDNGTVAKNNQPVITKIAVID